MARFFKAFPNTCSSTIDGFYDDDMDQKIYLPMFPKKKRCLMQMSQGNAEAVGKEF